MQAGGCRRVGRSRTDTYTLFSSSHKPSKALIPLCVSRVMALVGYVKGRLLLNILLAGPTARKSRLGGDCRCKNQWLRES